MKPRSQNMSIATLKCKINQTFANINNNTIFN